MTCPYCGSTLTRTRQDAGDPAGWPTCPTHGLLDDLDLRPHLTIPENTMNPENPTPLLLSVPDAARLLGLSPKTVRKLIASGELRTFTPVSRAYVVAEDVHRMIEMAVVR